MKFILTKELGRLSKWLRILGYDSLYFTESNVSTLIITSLREERIILTRNTRTGEPKSVRLLLVKSDHLKEQIAQVLNELNLKPDKEVMFSRCIICNEILEDIDREEVKDKVPEYVFKTQEEFITCPNCKRIYWQGTHWGNVQSLISQIQNPRISADKNLR